MVSNLHGPKVDNFTLIKVLLRICGISLQHGKEESSFRVFTIFCLLLSAFSVLQLFGASRYLKNEQETFEFVIVEVAGFTCLIKMIVMLSNRTLMGTILDKLQSGVFLPNLERGGEDEEMLVKSYVVQTKRQNMTYWILVTLTTVFATIDSLFWRLKSSDSHKWKYEYGPITIFNTSYSPNYEVASLYQNISWVALGWMFVVSDLLTVTVLAHITCQLKILQNSIRRIINNAYHKMKKDLEDATGINLPSFDQHVDVTKISWKYLEPVVSEVVKYHLAIIDIAEQIERTFNILVLLILLSAAAMIGGFSYRFQGVYIGGIGSQLCEIGMICYWGNEVSLESRNIIDACYDVNFVGVDIRLQKSLFLIMERSKKPIVFTAGKFSPLTLGTFISIARAGYSFLLILRKIT